MTIDEIAVLPPHILRDMIINWNAERNKHIFKFGFSLWRIKNESLWSQWGHISFYRYCRDELRLLPGNSENWRIAYYTRYLSLGITHAEMMDFETASIGMQLLRLVHNVCNTREEVLGYLDDPAARTKLKKQVKWQYRGKFQHEGGNQKNRQLRFADIGPFRYRSREYGFIWGVFSEMVRTFGFKHWRKGLLALGLLYRVMTQVEPAKRYKELKNSCLMYSIDAKFVDYVLGEEKWKGIKND